MSSKELPSGLVALIMLDTLFAADRMFESYGFSAEEKRHIPPLLICTYCASLQGHSITLSDAAGIMETKHNKTTKVYVDVAASKGLIDVAVSQEDKRVTQLSATPKLIEEMKREEANMLKVITNAFHATTSTGDNSNEFVCMSESIKSLPSLTRRNFRGMMQAIRMLTST